jgi:hypothetical protein
MSVLLLTMDLTEIQDQGGQAPIMVAAGALPIILDFQDFRDFQAVVEQSELYGEAEEASHPQIQEMYKNMKFIIKIENGEPQSHPILLNNFKQAFPEIDLDNLPSNFAWFERVSPPSMGPYEKNLTVKYEFVGNIVKDVWYVEPMSQQEIIEKQNLTKEQWKSTGYASWIFDESLCKFNPPLPYPDDGNSYDWDESQENWIKL